MMATDWQSSYRGARVLVLGASGFIGRWVARALVRQGADVHLVVRDAEHASQLFTYYGIRGQIWQTDISETQGLEKVIDNLKPSITFNLVGYGVDHAERDETLSYQINVEFVRRVCAALATMGVPGCDCRLVHVGSALEYGTIGGDLSEQSLARPTTIYGKNKLAGTQIVTELCQRFGFYGVTARLFTVYGPGEHSTRLLPTLIRSARTAGPIELTAGTQQRDFTYVEDVAEGLLRLGACQAAPGEVVNLATGRLVPVRILVETAAGILGLDRARLHFGAKLTRFEEMEHGPVNVTRLQQLTAWCPATSIDGGVHATVVFEERLRESGERLLSGVKE